MYPYLEIMEYKISSYQLMLLASFIIGGLSLRRIFLKLSYHIYLYMIILLITLISGLLGSHILNLLEVKNYSQIFSANVFRSGVNSHSKLTRLCQQN